MSTTGTCPQPPKKMKMQAEVDAFSDVYHEVAKIACQIQMEKTSTSMDDNLDSCSNWFREAFDYNVPHGKQTRGRTLVETYTILKLSQGEGSSEKELHMARVLGWCVEILQACFLVCDDIMDRSETRRGQPCWYKIEKVGNIAINDSLFFDSSIFHILKTYYSDKDYYLDLVELFNEIKRLTVIGQNLDTCAPLQCGEKLENFNMKLYKKIVLYKTAYYSFYLPVALAMTMAGIKEAQAYDTAKEILLQMGELFQVQDDYLDCFGDPDIIGKVGSDIKEKKCTWLIVQALAFSDEEQKSALCENYGQDDPKQIHAVKKVYEALELRKLFHDYEEKAHISLQTHINSCTILPKQIFQNFLRKVFKRNV